MRIREIGIDGFGVFAGEVAGELGPGLNVLHGDNEAGKSTLLAFVRAVLFGFPRGNAKENAYPPLRGGTHGGHLLLETDGGALVRVERRHGPRGGAVGVSDAGGAELPAGHLEQILGATSRDLFRNVYAFSLAELQSFETLQGDGVAAALYGASAGTSVLALPRVVAELERELGTLFKPAGRNPLLNALLAEHGRVQDELQQAKQAIARFDEASRRLREIAAEMAALREQLARHRAELERGEALLRSWPCWLELCQARRRLAELPPLPAAPFPEDGVARLDVLLGRRLEQERTLLAAEQSLRGLEETLAAIRPDPKLAAAAEEARRLRDGAGAYEERVLELERLGRERDEMDRTLLRIQSELGADWGEERLRAADRSLFAREEARQLEERMTASRALRQQTALEARERAREAAAARAEEERAGEPEAADETPPPAAAFAALGWLAVVAAALVAAFPEAIRRGLLDPPAALPFALEAALWVAAPLASLGVALIALHLLQSRRHRRRVAERERERIQRHEERVGAATALRAAAEQAAAAAEEAMRAAESDEEEVCAQWREWLESRALPATLSAATALEALQQIARAAEVLDGRATLERQAVLCEARQRQYEVLARMVFEQTAQSLPAAADLPAACRELSAACEAAAADEARRAEVEMQVATAHDARDVAARLHEATADEIRRLVAAAGAGDEEEFRHRGRLAADHAVLRSETSRLEGTLLTLGPGTAAGEAGPRLAALEAELAALRREDIEAANERLRHEVDAAEERLEALRSERAALEHERARLASADDVARLRVEQERLRAEMAAIARRWARARIARRLLEEARLRFQRDHQPRVLRDASDFLARMTAGAHRQVRASLDEPGLLEVVGADGAVRRPEQLSRGTAEQLYLALRFGTVLNHHAGAEVLPVVMDEVLVNFDPERARRAAAAIAELAQSRQVLYFTCQPATRDLLRSAAPGATSFRLHERRLHAEEPG